MLSESPDDDGVSPVASIFSTAMSFSPRRPPDGVIGGAVHKGDLDALGSVDDVVIREDISVICNDEAGAGRSGDTGWPRSWWSPPPW